MRLRLDDYSEFNPLQALTTSAKGPAKQTQQKAGQPDLGGLPDYQSKLVASQGTIRNRKSHLNKSLYRKGRSLGASLPTRPTAAGTGVNNASNTLVLPGRDGSTKRAAMRDDSLVSHEYDLEMSKIMGDPTLVDGGECSQEEAVKKV